MTVLFNNLPTKDQIACGINDRAIQFGDGLFETIKIQDQMPRLLSYHMSRLRRGAEAIGLSLPDYLHQDQLCADILRLMGTNNLTGNATAKLIVWRKPEYQKAYFGGDAQANTLLLVKGSPDLLPLKEHVSFSQEVVLHYWKLSRYKTISALPFVLAASERNQRGLDELILLNTKGYVTECVSSNIFWVKDDQLFTPSLQTGCVGGVMRSFLLDRCKEENIAYQEVEVLAKEILAANAVFTSNSQGLQAIQGIDSAFFPESQEILSGIKAALLK
ncbi:aminotransferase, class IV [Fulvivirga imtechensis AK7]|uniref:branched-chain-amino-acid transaminase n=1 Tax=Fulvivirga imtechensis AK7 TaxID=1237149 RepID=L8JZ72_9BACT|nr:aminotransferase class IV [Fulvivirga imtechensis]ELR73478.1 aminotransferase, class IV [Fulvivirga imtechensis AK7]